MWHLSTIYKMIWMKMHLLQKKILKGWSGKKEMYFCFPLTGWYRGYTLRNKSKKVRPHFSGTLNFYFPAHPSPSGAVNCCSSAVFHVFVSYGSPERCVLFLSDRNEYPWAGHSSIVSMCNEVWISKTDCCISACASFLLYYCAYGPVRIQR